MENPRAEKVAIVTEVREQFEAADAVVLTEYRGLKVSELAELRSSMRAAGGEYRIYKNTLVRRATSELDLDLSEHLTGPTAIAFVKAKADGSPGDIATVAKALQSFAKGNPLLVIKGGLLGETILDAGGAMALASLPTGPEIYSRLAGAIASGARGLASVINGVNASIAYALQAAIDAGAFAGEAPAAPVAEEAPAAAPVTEEASVPAVPAEGAAEVPADEPTAADEALTGAVDSDAVDSDVVDSDAVDSEEAPSAATETAATTSEATTSEASEEEEDN